MMFEIQDLEDVQKNVLLRRTNIKKKHQQMAKLLKTGLDNDRITVRVLFTTLVIVNRWCIFKFERLIESVNE